MNIRAHSLGVATAVTLAFVLVACTGVPVDPLPTIEVETLGVPSSMLPTEPYIDQSGAILSRSGELPWAFGGAVMEPGGEFQPAVWLSDDGVSWSQSVIDAGFSGSFIGQLAGSATLAALGGTVWKDRVLTATLWVSKDRRSWSAVTLPDEFAARYRIVTLNVTGNRVIAIGEAADGEAAGLLVVGTKVSQIELPTVKKGKLLNPLGIAGAGKSLVLTAQPGSEEDLVPKVAYRSSDGGLTWSKASVQIADSSSYVSGIVWTGADYVATGYVPGSSTAGASLRASSWVSADGKAWAAESVPEPPSDGPFRLPENAGEWFGAPSVNDGFVTVVAANQNSGVSALYRRSAAGSWTFGGTTSANESSGGGGMAIRSGSDAIVLLGASGYLRTGTFSTIGYADSATLAHREFTNFISDIHGAADRELFVLRKSVYKVDPRNWRNSSQFSLAEYTGGGSVVEAPWDPERVGSLVGVVMGSDGSGAEVIIGGEFPAGESVILAQGFFRPSPGDEWQTIRGFDSTGATGFSATLKVAETWLAVGGYRAVPHTGTPSHAIVWTSADGLNWSRAVGDFGAGLLESSLADACELLDGTPIGIGSIEASTGSYRMAAWSPSDGSWQRLELGKFGELEGYASSCASDQDGVVVAASIGGRDVLLRTTDGQDWKQVFKAERGISLSNPVAVAGGFAAAGSWSNDSTAGAVVWLSRDGISWKPVAIPSRNSGSTSMVATHGDDLLVTMSARTGDPILVIRDIENAIDRLAPPKN